MSEFMYNFKCGHKTKCEYIKPSAAKTQSFTIVYAHGFCSDPYGRKPEEVKKWCIENGVGFFRFEIAGHGSDIDTFEKTTIDTYREQMFEIVNDMVDGDVVTAGSSLGGWLGLMAAVKFPQKVKGFIGMAAAPDFLKTFMDKFFTDKDRDILARDGKLLFPTNDFTYTITREMLLSADANLMLNKDCIPFNGKVRLIQGINDAALEWPKAPLIAQKLTSNDVKICLLKSSNHRLGSDEDIKELRHFLDDFLN